VKAGDRVKLSYASRERSCLLATAAVSSLAVLPVAVLLAVLARSGSWGESIQALKGKYNVLGLPYNPWPAFLCDFLPAVLAAVAFAVVSFVISWRSGLATSHARPLGFVAVVLFVLLASASFSLSIMVASLVSLWFRDGIVLGLGDSTAFWIVFAAATIILLLIHRLLRSQGS
jgi:hypothetical protein